MLNLKTTGGLNLKFIQVVLVPKTIGTPDLLFVCIDQKSGTIHRVKEEEIESIGK